MSDAFPQYRCIGKGFCGTVWTTDNEDAIKREDGGPGRSLTNDYAMHLRIIQGFIQYPPSTSVTIPQCRALIEPINEAWWSSQLPRFPEGFEACRALVSERIPPIPRSASDKIVDRYCVRNQKLASFVKNNREDDDCIVRPLLGRRRNSSSANSIRPTRFFSLRNVQLHVDQMEALGLDVKAYAETMAETLAVIHWGAQVDANDVEFVLAPPRSSSPSSNVFHSDFLGDHTMWILDFDCVRTMTMDEAGVEQACAAFYKNDRFYPRPSGREAADEMLWEVFKKRFLEASNGILGQGNESGALPRKLMDRIEQEGHTRQDK